MADLGGRLKVHDTDCLFVRVQEREENVRLDVVSCFTCLLKVRRC